MGMLELQDTDKLLMICVRNLKIFVIQMNCIPLLMIGIKPKCTINLEDAEVGNPKAHPDKKAIPEDGLYRHLSQNIVRYQNRYHILMKKIKKSLQGPLKKT